MERTTVPSGTEWESHVGYSRAVRAGPHVHVSGTTATDEDGDLVGEGDVTAQAERAFANVERALSEAGATLADVVRTRMYVVDVGDWEAIGRVHADYFGDVRPATSMVEVAALIDPRMLLEVEATAIVDGETHGDRRRRDPRRSRRTVSGGRPDRRRDRSHGWRQPMGLTVPSRRGVIDGSFQSSPRCSHRSCPVRPCPYRPATLIPRGVRRAHPRG